MIIFYTQSTLHLKIKSEIENGSYIVKQFCDGEVYVKLTTNVENKDVWVISSIASPAENIIELCLLLDALQRAKAKINIFFTYFSYLRQDRVVEPLEALSTQVICNFFKQFQINKILILHAHSKRLNQFLNFQSVIPNDLYYPIIDKIDVVIAPDKGAIDYCQEVAKVCKKEFAWLEKVRPDHEQVQILKINGDAIKGKKVIIMDDIITTGNTIINATDFLIQSGAKSVEVIATHGIFCNGSIEKINQSQIQKIYVTNSFDKKISSSKIEVIDISKYILKVI